MQLPSDFSVVLNFVRLMTYDLTRGEARGGKRGICPPPLPEVFSVITSLQTKILMLQRKSTNNASRGGLKLR